MDQQSTMASSQSIDELVDEMNTKFTYTVLPVTVFVGFEIVIGFVGNVLVLIVVNAYYKLSNFKYFVLCLAVIDIICCCITMPGEMYSQTNWYRYTSVGMCKVKSFCNLFTVIAEAVCLLTIALDRYRKVCRPLGWQIKPRMAKYLCFVFFAIAFVLSFPLFFLWGIREVKDTYNGREVGYHVCEKDGSFDSTEYPFIHLVCVAGIVGVLLLIMLGMYILVAKTLIGKPIHRANCDYSFTAPPKPFGTLSRLSKIVAEQSSDFDTEGDTELSSSGASVAPAKAICERNELTSDTKDLSASNQSEAVVPEDNINKSSSPHVHASGRTESRYVDRSRVASRVRRKTLIMFILTITFIITMIIYFVLINLIASSGDFVENLSDSAKTVYYFFLRFYFINHAMNPFVYGFLDPKFKSGVKKFRHEVMKKMS